MLLENFGLLFFNTLFGVINGLAAMIFTPIVTMINDLFLLFDVNYANNLLTFLTSFQYVINNIIFPNAIWVCNLFPPITFTVCMMFISLWLLIWSYELTAYVVLRILKFFKTVIPFV